MDGSGLRQVDAGNIVHASDANPMLILTQLQPIAVIFTLPEDVLPSCRPDEAAERWKWMHSAATIRTSSLRGNC